MENKDLARERARTLVLCNSDRAFVMVRRFYSTPYGLDKSKDTYALTNLWTGSQGTEVGL